MKNMDRDPLGGFLERWLSRDDSSQELKYNIQNPHGGS